MRVLLLHRDDDLSGPWSRQRWDLIVDLGRAPQSLYDEWSRQQGCPVRSIWSLARELEDLEEHRKLLEAGLGRLVDGPGMDERNLDWWDLVFPSLQAELEDVLLLSRLAKEIPGCRELVTSRPVPRARVLGFALGCRITAWQEGLWSRFSARRSRYRAAWRNLSHQQIRQVVFDKYDTGYAWRRRWAGKSKASSSPAVLLPSAYVNVSRTAVAHARSLPEQRFLLVLARESAAIPNLPANVACTRLASYAVSPTVWRRELAVLQQRWTGLTQELRQHPVLDLAGRVGVLDLGRAWLRLAVPVRHAWNEVFRKENIVGCLSADDSNPYTRIPLIVAQQRGKAALACHHGALDLRMAFKLPHADHYLAQGPMEEDYLLRVCGLGPDSILVGDGLPQQSPPPATRDGWQPWIVFFSDSYETDVWRAESVFAEILPPLCEIARRSGRNLVVKLHPFESLRQRREMLLHLLAPADFAVIEIIDDPLSTEMLKKIWFAVTVESTTALECVCAGVPAFLMGWLRHAYSGYALQFARFGAGQLLDSAADLARIPELLAVPVAADVQTKLRRPLSPERLSAALTHQSAGTARMG